MKLTVKSGESIEHAVQYIQDFLEKYKEEYPLLRGNMNLYISLEGVGHRDCPDNDREFILTEEAPVDVEANRIAEKKKETLMGWARYLSSKRKELQKAMFALESARSSWDAAVKKGLKEETIANRKLNIQQCQDSLKAIEQNVRLAEKLDDYVEDGRFKWFFVKHGAAKTPYTYKLIPHMIFTTKAGENYYFVGYESLYNKAPYGGLNPGLPHGYEQE